MSARRQFAEDLRPPPESARQCRTVLFTIRRQVSQCAECERCAEIRSGAKTTRGAPASRQLPRAVHFSDPPKCTALSRTGTGSGAQLQEKRDAATIMDVCAGAALPCRKRDAAADGNLKVLVGGWREALLRSGYSLWRSPDDADEHPSLHRDDHLGIRRRGDLGR